MSNHFTGLSLGPPLGDQRLDLCDLYAFQSPADKNRTVIILNANPNADALHPDAIYRLNIDNDGDYLTDIAFSYVFSKPQNGRQTVSVLVATGSGSRSAEPVGTKIIAVVIDVQPIDCVGMKCVRVWICIEDDHGSVLVSGRLECVQVAEVESLIAKRRAKTESGEMV